MGLVVILRSEAECGVLINLIESKVIKSGKNTNSLPEGFSEINKLSLSSNTDTKS